MAMKMGKFLKPGILEGVGLILALGGKAYLIGDFLAGLDWAVPVGASLVVVGGIMDLYRAFMK